MRKQYPSHISSIMPVLPEHVEIVHWHREKSDLVVAVKTRAIAPIRCWVIFYGNGRAITGDSTGTVSRVDHGFSVFRISLEDNRFVKLRLLARIEPPFPSVDVANDGLLDRVTIIVPVRDRLEELRCVLAGLAAQSLPRDLYEVIVIDDGSKDAVQAVIREYSGRLDVRTFRHRYPQGRSAARNTGIKHAKYPILLFLDGDSIPSRDLVLAHLRMHSRRAVIALGTRLHVHRSVIASPEKVVEPGYMELKRCESLRTHRVCDSREEWYRITHGLEWEPFPWIYAITCNLSIPTVLARAVLFDEAFTGLGCADTDFAWRAHLNKVRPRFLPAVDAVVYHIEHARNQCQETMQSQANRRKLCVKFVEYANELRQPSEVIRQEEKF